MTCQGFKMTIEEKQKKISTPDTLTQAFLPTDTFTHRRFSTQITFTQKPLSQADALTHRCLCTHAPLHTDIFTYRRFYTQKLLHIWRFYTQKLLDTNTFTHRRCYTQTLLQPKVLDTNAFTHTHTQTHTHTHAQTHIVVIVAVTTSASKGTNEKWMRHNTNETETSRWMHTKWVRNLGCSTYILCWRKTLTN